VEMTTTISEICKSEPFCFDKFSDIADYAKNRFAELHLLQEIKIIFSKKTA